MPRLPLSQIAFWALHIGCSLGPCRELAFQLADQFRALGVGMSLKDSVVVGGLDMTAQAKELARRPHVVIATPGRLRALMELDAALARAFARTRFLVLDEADRLLEPSFEAELAVVLGALPAQRQTLLFSATMTQTLEELQGQLLQDAYHFQVGGCCRRGDSVRARVRGLPGWTGEAARRQLPLILPPARIEALRVPWLRLQAYEGLQTAKKLRQEYLFIPAKVGRNAGGWQALGEGAAWV